jgi:O-6-methylguanine DNA methyltransferase
MTYKQVATLAGKPLAYRAVGNILNKNPDLKNIPCHRVIRSDGSVGGYVFGPGEKNRLLKNEKITALDPQQHHLNLK